MKRLLIVEDEKMIRQGIRAIVQRSALPVDEVLECKNGKEALELLQAKAVDVMITDIRMPVMSGLELVHEAQKIADPPLIVIISGYDEFSYAVDMMREGVRDYLLKPVNRQKLLDVLFTLDKELESQHVLRQNSIVIGKRLLQALLLGAEIVDAELPAAEEQLNALLATDRYIAICLPATADLPRSRADIVFFPNLNGHLLALGSESCLDGLTCEEYRALYAGVSLPHSGAGSLHAAFLEAEEARGAAFLQGASVRFAVEKQPYGTQESGIDITQIVYLFGADNIVGVRQALGQILLLAQNRQITPPQFALLMKELTAGIDAAFPDALNPDEVRYFSAVWVCASAYGYYMALCAALETASRRMQSSRESRTKSRIAQAVLYVKEFYRSDVNMAQVSNYISMNYSQFSYLFKLHTGSNFQDYIKNLRLEECMRMLRETELRVGEVSRRAGFKNEKHFMKVFKQATGISPSEYRKMNTARKI